MITPGVSVIICCYNSSERLPETLRHLALQQVSANISWEIIVVNNKSTDNTAEVAILEWKKYNSVSADFTVIEEPTPGKNYAFKTGINKAKFSYILTCDDDNWLYPDYIHQVFNIMQADANIGALGGQGVFEPQKPAWDGIKKFTSRYVNGPQFWAPTEHWVYGAGSAYRKDALDSIFKKQWCQITTGRKGTQLLSGEDVEICFMFYLLGYKIIANDHLLFNHYVPLKRQNENYLLQLSFWQSWSNVLLYSYYHLFNCDERPIKKVLDNWLVSAAKTKLSQLLRNLIPGKRLTIEQKIILKNHSGTFLSLLKNRNNIAAHHQHLKNLVVGIDADKLNGE